MKKSNKYIFTVIFLALALSGCSIGKILTRNSARTAGSKEIETGSIVRKDQSSFREQGILLSDSSRHNYKVMIFPQDSFSFSFQDGFQGQAQRIEIYGSAEHLAKGQFYQVNLKNGLSDSSGSFKENSRVVERVVSKDLKKHQGTGIIFVVIACMVIAGCCWWRFRK